MYLLELFFENSTRNGDGHFRFQKMRNSGTISKWTPLKNDKAGREILILITVGLGGEKYLNAVPVPTEVVGEDHRPLRVAHVLARHYPLDIQTRTLPLLGSGVDVDAGGHVVALRTKDLSLVPSHVPARKLNIGKRSSAYFFLAYGKVYRPGPEKEDFHFTDPLFRRTRFHSLLMPDAPLTNPVDFMARLRYKGIRWGRTPSKNVFHALCTQLSKKLNVKTDSWPDMDMDPNDAWTALHPWQQRAVLPILDMARHMMDAFPGSANPLEMPGVVLMDQPETFCTRGRFPNYLTLLDTLFPRIQFIVSIGTTARKSLPTSFREKRLPIPEGAKPQKKSGTRAYQLLASDGSFERD